MIIGLTGLAGSGKSEVAAALREFGGFKRVPLAGPLKSMLETVGFTHAQLWGDEKATPLADFGGKTPRHIMQTLGTDWGRQMVDQDIWITLWKKSVTVGPHADYNVVVDDVRFPNEVEAVRALGGQVWRVERPGVATMGHESETHIANLAVDRILPNTAGLYELREMARSAYQHAAYPPALTDA